MVYVANRKLDFSKIWVMREINERGGIKYDSDNSIGAYINYFIIVCFGDYWQC